MPPVLSVTAIGSSPLARGLHITGDIESHLPGIIPARAGFTGHRCDGPLCDGDHPRSRGVYGLPRACHLVICGSSPLARGLRDAPLIVAPHVGIIPARAGFTSSPTPTPTGTWDHPRSRGVYMLMSIPDMRTWGSSPLARGLLQHGLDRRPYEGIIPARAGFTLNLLIPDDQSRDHPRSRGVYVYATLWVPAPTGSSPLARGLLSWSHTTTAAPRIIPARAGFTDSNYRDVVVFPDHPRSRGVYVADAVHSHLPQGSSPLARGLLRYARTAPSETMDHPRSRGVYASKELSAKVGAGSSPLARGLRAREVQGAAVDGIIPARAGFTVPARSVSVASTGSSPLARGLLVGREDECVIGGIIPARAGFTTGVLVSMGGVPDHPRSRGVYSGFANVSMWAAGSSPLARGLLLRIQSLRVQHGIIPARAGFTPSSP